MNGCLEDRGRGGLTVEDPSISLFLELPDNEARKKFPYSVEDGTFVRVVSPHFDCVNDAISFPSGSSHALGNLVPNYLTKWAMIKEVFHDFFLPLEHMAN
jgi:hypothetical protein